MNNNRNNNRRRGRGNRQQGGGNQNRIDSRARGNAPQLLDKYKKLAQDAAHNGDRVQAEYFLQFADHYFRVIADNKARQDEQRGGGRQNDRDYQPDEDEGDDEFDTPRQQQGGRNDRQQQGRQQDRQGDRSYDRQQDRSRQRRGRDDDYRASEGDSGDEGEDSGDFEPADNPFTRGNRERGRGRTQDTDNDGGTRRGRGRRPARGSDEDGPADDAGEIDAAALPPSFSAIGDEETAEKPKRKLPPRRRRPADDADEGGESLKAVG